MRGCLYSCERVLAGPGSSAATNPRGPGPPWTGSLSRLLSLQVTQGALDWMSRLIQPSRQGKRFISFFVQKRESLFYFRLIGLFLLQSFIELSFLAEAVSILVFITHPMFDYHMVAIQSYYPSTNITLIHRVGLQPG